MFGGMACINFSRPKMSVANQANLFRAVGQDIFLVGAVGNNNRRSICEPALWHLQRPDSSMVDYRDDSIAIPDKVPDRTALRN
jgi:hypothetical protein